MLRTFRVTERNNIIKILLRLENLKKTMTGVTEGDIHANYLLSATKHVNKISSNALRCHLNILFTDIMQMKKLVLSKRQKVQTVNCEYCLTPWRNGLFSIKVMPQPKRGKKLRKILNKLKAEKKLSKVQKNLADAMHPGQTIVLNCKICHKSCKFKVSPDLKKNMEIIEVCAQPDYNLQENDKVKIMKKQKKKKKKKKQKAFSGLNPVIMEQISGTTANNAMQDKNKINTLPDEDDVIIIDENTEVSEITDINPKKRKLEDEDDDVIDILEPEPGKIMKMEVEDDVILANPLAITPLGSNSKQFAKRNDDFIPLDTSSSTSQRNDKSNNFHNQRNQKRRDQNFVSNNSNEKQPERNKKKNLNRWKKLIADDDAKPIKTSSLQDFLSAL